MNYISTFIYRLRKILSFMLSPKCKNKSLSECVYCFNFNEKYFHLGDELFFYPSIIWLKKNNYAIHITGSKLKLFNENAIEGEKIWLIRPDMYISKQTNFDVWKGRSLISKDIMKNIFHLVNKEFTEKEYEKCKNLMIDKLSESADKTIVNIMNNNQYNVVSTELDSGYWRYSKSYLKNTRYIFSKIDREYPLILVGTDDSSYLPENFQLNQFDIDLRGKTSINQLIGLLMNNKVKNIYTYDTFIYHLCCLLDKKNECFVRGQINIKKIKKRFIPAF